MKPTAALETLIARQPTATIASVDADGYPNQKAMLAPRKRDGLKTLWFTTNTSSMRVAQYRQNPKAAVYFCDHHPTARSARRPAAASAHFLILES